MLLTLGFALALVGGAAAAPPAEPPDDQPGGPCSPQALGEKLARRAETAAPRTAALRGRSGFPVVDSAEAWRYLPPATRGGGQPLPPWARALAPALPRTTAAMLELDYLHRARSPLPPRLRGELRWAAAHANACRYSEAEAASDLRAAGMSEADVRALADAPTKFPEAERAALAFARKLTLAGYTVTDAEFARLLQLYGDKQVVAMVLLLAHASFQDRLLLALGPLPEGGGPLKPLEVQFASRPFGAGAVRRTGRPVGAPRTAPAEQVADAGRLTPLDFAQAREGLDQQRARRSRIPLPGDRPGQIRWGLVCRHYQPEMAAAWSACTHAFALEAEQNPVLEQSLFWVVTQTVRCFY